MEPIQSSSCCTAKDTVADAARAMRTSGCGCAPVVEDLGNLAVVGVITERDVCCSVASDERPASEVPVVDIMRAPSACCGAIEPVERVRRALHEQRATSLPVVDAAGACCGIVSAHRLDALETHVAPAMRSTTAR
ncbi:MAG: CBS domain-containing protein [Vicinamibacteraceae bacterium]